MKYEKLKLLDDILRELKSSTEQNPIDIGHILFLYSPEISARDKKGIRDKLSKDGYIEDITLTFDIGPDLKTGDVAQFITFDGLIHLEQDGGYLGKRERANRKEGYDTFLKSFVIVSFLISAGALYVNILSYLDKHDTNPPVVNNIESHCKRTQSHKSASPQTPKTSPILQKK